MSTELSFWKPGELDFFLVSKAATGFIAEVHTKEEESNPAGPISRTYRHAFERYPDALELLAECFAWDASEAAPDRPVSAKFPDTFVRFDIEGSYVTAVFREWGVECRRTVEGLSRHIQWLADIIHLDVDERRPWFAVLAGLRVNSAAAVAKEGAA